MATLINDLQTVLVTNVTPLQENGDVDHTQLAYHSSFLVEQGVSVIAPCGNTGEFTSLSLDEAKAVTATVTEAVGDGDTTVIAGIGWSLPMAIELGRHAQEVGADGVLVHHPMHTYIDRDGLQAYYERIIEALDIGVVLYKRGPELTDALIRELVQDEQVVGVKYAVNDVNAFANLVQESSAAVTWMCGTAERWAPFFAVGGAQAFSSGLANFAPEKALHLYEALAVGDYDKAMTLREDLVEFEEIRQLRYNGNNVPTVKYAMKLLGLCGSTVRDPLLDLDAEGAAAVRRIIEAWGLDRKRAHVEASIKKINDHT